MTLDGRARDEPIGRPAHYRLDDVAHRHVHALGGERGHPQISQAARDDMAEHGEIRLDVQGEAVHGAPPVDPHPDSADLPCVGTFGIHPDTWIALKPAGPTEPEVTDGIDDELLDRLNMCRHGAQPHRDVEDRVADELTGPVVSDVAATIGVHELSADRLRVHEDVLGDRAHAKGVHVWVLEQEQVLCSALSAQGLLQDVGVPVPDTPKPADAQLPAGNAQSSASQSRDSMTRASSRRNADAYAPSTARWSNERASRPTE